MASTLARAPVPAWRIVIAGGGAVGLALALALTRALGRAVSVTVADPAFAAGPRPDHRAFAISPASARMLDALGVWKGLRARAQPIDRMTITDSRLGDTPRPAYLDFRTEHEGPLAYMVQARDVSDALLAAARGAAIDLDPTGLATFTAEPAAIVVRRQDGRETRAALLVAADGARSRLRDEAGLAWLGRGYPQSGLAATLRHARDQGGRATQHFLPSGPFAILPLVPGEGAWPYRSSLVWTERSERVPALLAMGPDEIAREITARAGPEIGEIALDSPLQAFPLAIGQARRSVARRFALIGDAAHQIHPLAGHGLNLGLGDAAALAERIVDCVRLGLDPGDAPVLDGYERDRRAATLAMAASTDVLNRLFSNDSAALRGLRDIGLGLVDRSPRLKRLFVEGATEGLGSAGRLMRGQPL